MFMSWFKLLVMASTAALILAGCAERPIATKTVPLASQPTVKQEIGAVAHNSVEIRFPLGGYRLSPEANQKLDLAARLFRDVNPVVMYSMGYTDPQGSEFNNITLSARRALAVKQGLIARGIPADRVLIQAFGKSDPAIPNDPDSPKNRRVIIQWRLV